jgi:biopolymer transport protein ExbD
MAVERDVTYRRYQNGVLVSETTITEDATEDTIKDRLRDTIDGLIVIQQNDATNLAQVNEALDRLAKATIGLIRVVVREGLLDDDTGTE